MKINPYNYLESLNVDKMLFGLKSITELLLRLGNPQKSYKTIIIGGTNGKGSTAAMSAAILQSAGCRVGLYTSPHLVDVRERIVLNGRKISRSDFSRMIAHVKDNLRQPVTYFEFLTAVALVYFQNKKVDIAVLEVGLGGRLDATNVCKPLVSVITNVAFDHMDYLGDTLESIAYEKAGIIKQHGVCITAAKQKTVLNVLKDVCLRRRATLYCVGRDIKIRKEKDGLLTYQGVNRHLKKMKSPLRGEHQLDNLALALSIIECCEQNGLRVADKAIFQGLAHTCWEARLEVLQKNPFFILDGAHNPAGMNALCRSLKEDFSYRQLIFIFGVLADKDYKKMMKEIAPLASHIILTQLRAKRAVPVKDLKECATKMGYVVSATENVQQAIAQALSLAGKKDLICATGSFYLAGEIKQLFPKITLCANNRR